MRFIKELFSKDEEGDLTSFNGNLHTLSFLSMDGKEVPFKKFKGKKLLLVNLAVDCGFTNQFEELIELQEEFKEELQIIGFPNSQFEDDGPKTSQEFLKISKERYKVNFPLSKMVKVKGKGISPIYKWLTDRKLNGRIGSEVEWNFQKYLIDENGDFLAVFQSATSPLGLKIRHYLEKA